MWSQFGGSQANPLPAVLPFHVGSSSCLSCYTSPPALSLSTGKSTEDVPSPWTMDCMWDNWKKVLALGFGFAQLQLLWLCRGWARRWKPSLCFFSLIMCNASSVSYFPQDVDCCSLEEWCLSPVMLACENQNVNDSCSCIVPKLSKLKSCVL